MSDSKMSNNKPICVNEKCNHNENNYNPMCKKYYKHKHSHNENPHSGYKKVNLFGKTLSINKESTENMNEEDFYKFCLYNLYKQSVSYNNKIEFLKNDLIQTNKEIDNVYKRQIITKKDIYSFMNEFDVYINNLKYKLKNMFYVFLGVFLAYLLLILIAY